MAYNSTSITSNWNGIQIRSVDPYANVDSDIANNLHLIYSNPNMYFTGLGIKGYTTPIINSNRYVVIRLYPGTVMMNNVSISFTGESYNESHSNDASYYEMRSILCELPQSLTSLEVFVVVEYSYSKVPPVPYAQIKSITSNEFDSSKHLKLYKFTISACEYSDNFISNTWSSKYSIIDLRYQTGIIFRSGDTMSGHLRIMKEVSDYTSSSDYNAVNKKYVEERIVNTGLGNSVLKSGSVNYITTPIIWKYSRVPQSDNELITKGYSNNNYINKNENSTLTGKITLSGSNADIIVPSPKTDSSVVNKKYISDVLGRINSSSFLNAVTGGEVGGIITLTNSVVKLSGSGDNNKLISKGYADTIYVKTDGTSNNITAPLYVNTNTYTIDADNGSISTLVTKKYCDETYVSNSSSSPVTFKAVPKLTSTISVTSINDNKHFVTKEYCDGTYLKSTFTSSNSNDSAGSLKLNDGFIFKWGKVTAHGTFANTEWVQVNFASAFTNYCFNVVVTWVYSSGISLDKHISPCVKNITKTSFYINLGPYNSTDVNLSDENITFYYQAIGK